MSDTITIQRISRIFATVTVLMLAPVAGALGQSKTLEPNTRFFIPVPPAGAVQQVEGLLRDGEIKNALLITAMEKVPQAVWLTGGTTSEVSSTVQQTLREAHFQRSLPVLVLYNIPGRDCGSYSAGGAENTADYEAWIDAIAATVGEQQAVGLVEP